MPIPKLLSKTKLMSGYRCLKCAYLTVHHPELKAPITPEKQALFDEGNRVGEEARKRFPNGILVTNPPWDFYGSLKKTRELIAAGVKTIYEPAFEYQGCFARVDVIQFSKETEKWSLYEVKSSTKLRLEQVDDVGLQAWIIAGSGLKLEKISVMHLNSECKYPDLENLFTIEDVTQQIRDKYRSIMPKVKEIFETVHLESAPDIDLGPYCVKPGDCDFKEVCFTEKKIPEISVFNLPQIQDRKWELYKEGIIHLDDERLKDLTETQQRMVEAEKTGQRFVNQSGVKEALSTWKFPLVFLDFETINPSIPEYAGTSPKQQVPFQFSVDVAQKLDGPLTHAEYLHKDATDPRPVLISALLKACEGSGSIVAYYAQFESARIQEMADCFPEHREKLLALLPRMVDPLPIIREHVYDKAFHGSFSLKAVGPALLGDRHSYEGMKVGNGLEAQRAYQELTDGGTPPARKDEIYKSMLEYCGKDTWVMVELVKWLYQV